MDVRGHRLLQALSCDRIPERLVPKARGNLPMSCVQINPTYAITPNDTRSVFLSVPRTRVWSLLRKYIMYTQPRSTLLSSLAPLRAAPRRFRKE
jgi:hypothetical protein